MTLKPLILQLSVILASTALTQANTIGTNDVTTTLGPNFFFDAASTGGGDTASSASTTFTRDFGSLGGGLGLTTVSITGLGWAVGGNMPNSTPTTLFATLSITYLGADNAVGGGDDVFFGSVSDSYEYAGVGREYAWQFTTPLTLDIVPNATVNNFQLVMSGYTDNTLATAYNLRFKTTGTGTQPASLAKLSVAGTVVVVPEPATITLMGLGLTALLIFRRPRP